MLCDCLFPCQSCVFKRNKFNFCSVLRASLTLHETLRVHDSMNRSKLNLLLYKCPVCGRDLIRSVREGMKDISNVKVHSTNLSLASFLCRLQTMQNQIRSHNMWRLISFFTVCSLNELLKFECN